MALGHSWAEAGEPADIALGVLAVSGATHARSFGPFVVQLRAHRVWPEPFVPLIAGAVVALELGIFMFGSVALLSGAGSAPATRLPFVVAAALYAVYGVYLLWVRRTSDEPVPCACSSTPVPVTAWSVGRALALAGIALYAAVMSGSVAAPTQATGLIAVVGALPCAIALWLLPEAMASLDPSVTDRMVAS